MLLPSSDPWQNASPHAVFSLSGWLGMQQRGPCQAHFQEASVARGSRESRDAAPFPGSFWLSDLTDRLSREIWIPGNDLAGMATGTFHDSVSPPAVIALHG